MESKQKKRKRARVAKYQVNRHQMADHPTSNKQMINRKEKILIIITNNNNNNDSNDSNDNYIYK